MATPAEAAAVTGLLTPMMLAPVLAVLDVAQIPDRAWTAAGHNKTAWWAALILPIPIVQWVALLVYLARIRPSLRRGR